MKNDLQVPPNTEGYLSYTGWGNPHQRKDRLVQIAKPCRQKLFGK